MLERKGHRIEEGKVTIGLDNSKVCIGILKETQKISKNMKDARAEIVTIRESLKKIKFYVEFELM